MIDENIMERLIVKMIFALDAVKTEPNKRIVIRNILEEAWSCGAAWCPACMAREP